MSADRSTQDRMGRWLAIAASVVVVATVVAAIRVMGSPSAQREMKLDSRRIDDLNHIVQVIEHYAELNNALPADLATLARQPGQRLAITDPVDGAAYGYEVTGKRSYRLCAVFATDTAKTPAMDGRWNADDWDHGAGRYCFERRAKPLVAR
ncbi:MAG: hypothetical protein ACREPV_08365 [Lysobacter sp.]